MSEPSSIVKLLFNELHFRQMLNPRYSLRAFARDLSLAPSSLSEIFSGRKGVSLRRGETIMRKLNVSKQDQEPILEELRAGQNRANEKRASAGKRSNENRAQKVPNRLQLLNELVSHWAYFAVLETLHLKDFQPDEDWIAKRLNMPVEQVRIIVRRLLDLNLLEVTPEGRWMDRNEAATTSDGIQSRAIVDMHLSLLERCKNALVDRSVTERTAKALIFALPSAALPKVEHAIGQFQQALVAIAMEHKGADDVQCLTIHRFALSQPGILA